MKTQNKKYYLEYLLLYTLLFAVFTAGAFAMFLVYGKSLLWKSDGLSLYIPKAYYFINEIRTFFSNLLHGKIVFPMYDFTIGMGDATPIHFEPLYWLFLLFDPEQVEGAFNFIFILRFYLAGLAMSLYLFYFKVDRGPTLLASFAYIYTEFTLGSASRHSQFVAPMILLPLGLLVIEEIMKNKKWYLCTLFAWLHLWVGFYFLYMNTIAMGIYFLVRFFMTKEGRNFKNFIINGMIIGWSYVLGVVIGNVVLLNTFASYLTSSRVADGSVKKITLNKFLLYPEMYKRCWKIVRQFLTIGISNSTGVKLGFTPILFLAAVMVFLYRGKWQRKILILITTSFCFFRCFPFIFSGFDTTTYRWAYMFSFVLAVNLAMGMKELLNLNLIRKVLVSVSVIPFFLVLGRDFFKYGRPAKIVILLSVCSICLTVLAIWLVNMKKLSLNKKYALLMAVQVIAVAVLGIEQFSPQTNGIVEDFAPSGKVLESALDTPLTVTTELEDDSFYRVATNESRFGIKGAAMIAGLHTNVFDQNTASKNWKRFYQKMGLSQWTLVRKRGFNGRAFLETLSDVKYYVAKEGQEYDVPYGYSKVQTVEKNGKNYHIYENAYPLPIGYTYAHTITEEELDAYDTAARPEVLMQAAVVEEDATDDITPVVSSVDVPIKDIAYSHASFEGGKISLKPKKDEAARIDISFEPQKDCELYLCFIDMVRDGNEKDNVWYGTDRYTEKYSLAGKGESYYTSQPDYIFPLGYFNEEVSSCFFYTDTKMTLDCSQIKIVAQPVDKIADYVADLKSEALENVVMDDNYVSGDISLKEDKFLVFSIPHRNGWTAYVDGEKAELEPANILYMGIRLTAGDHKVELKYATPGVFYSLVASFAGLVLFVLLYIVHLCYSSGAKVPRGVLHRKTRGLQ